MPNNHLHNKEVSRPTVVSNLRRRDFFASLAVLSVVLAGCGSPQGPAEGQVGFIPGFFGGVVADEPHAVLVARDVLSAGGTAADAGVALAFTLTATLPSRAGLGGGGLCLVHNPGLGFTETLDFLPPPGTGPGPEPMAVPAMARGMLALHARYGRLDWRLLIAPAEQQARLGHRPARAARAEFSAHWPSLRQDQEALRLFGGGDGMPPAEGERLQNPELAALLGQIRAKGAGDLYAGAASRLLLQGYRELGDAVTAEDLRGYLPQWRPPVAVAMGNERAYFASGEGSGGVVAARTLAVLAALDYGSPDSPDRAHRLVEALRQAIAAGLEAGAAADAGGEIPDAEIRGLAASVDRARTAGGGFAGRVDAPVIGGGDTGFVVVDPNGMAVACTLTIGAPFGIGRIAGRTGLFPARLPADGRHWISPVVVANPNTSRFTLAVAGQGGVGGLSSQIEVLIGAMIDRRSIADATGAGRVSLDPASGAAVLESRSSGLADALRQRGHAVNGVETLGRVNIVYCPSGLPAPEAARICAVGADGRGWGLAEMADQ